MGKNLPNHERNSVRKKKTDTKALSNNNNNPKLIYEKSLVTLTEKSKKYFKSKVV